MRPPFTGEKMACVLCGKERVSDPAVQSDWRSVEFRGQRFYACLDEFPTDGASVEEFEGAYDKFLKAAILAFRARASRAQAAPGGNGNG